MERAQSEYAAFFAAQLRHDQSPVVRSSNRLRSQQRQVSWLMARHAERPSRPARPVAHGVLRSPNTVTGSYRTHTCFPFNPRSEKTTRAPLHVLNLCFSYITLSPACQDGVPSLSRSSPFCLPCLSSHIYTFLYCQSRSVI